MKRTLRHAPMARTQPALRQRTIEVRNQRNILQVVQNRIYKLNVYQSILVAHNRCIRPQLSTAINMTRVHPVTRSSPVQSIRHIRKLSIVNPHKERWIQNDRSMYRLVRTYHNLLSLSSRSLLSSRADRFHDRLLIVRGHSQKQLQLNASVVSPGVDGVITGARDRTSSVKNEHYQRTYKIENRHKNDLYALEKTLIQKMDSTLVHIRNEFRQETSVNVVNQVRHQLSQHAGEITKDVLKRLQQRSRIEAMRGAGLWT
ncbi:MAG: hypothetical protein AB7G93_15415 [Bdellovibrionales bacterium]